MRLLAVMLSVLLAVPVGAADWLALGMGTAGMADLATTEYGLRLGGRELNPLFQDQVVRVTVKVAATAGYIYLYHRLKKKNRFQAVVLAATAIAVWGLMAAWNMYQIRKFQHGLP